VPDRKVDATRLFYHYLQKELLESDIWLFQMLTARLVTSLGIWLHPSIYGRLPVVVPYAARDPGSRGNKAAGIPDSWGAPNKAGVFRDDNSLIKGLPRSLPIQPGTSRLYRNARIGRGFVAAHVWPHLTTGEIAARHRLTYSFVPNLVWLPTDVAALTDREGSFTQTYVQALSVKIYRGREVAEPARRLAEEAWDLLPVPQVIPEQGLPDSEELNFFQPTDSWLRGRFARICLVADALEDVMSGKPLTESVISRRYTAGLPSVSRRAARALRDDLRHFAESV
jgi:hypothetical protein